MTPCGDLPRRSHRPQHRTAPSLWSAHECSLPLPTATTLLGPGTFSIEPTSSAAYAHATSPERDVTQTRRRPYAVTSTASASHGGVLGSLPRPLPQHTGAPEASIAQCPPPMRTTRSAPATPG